MNHADLLDVLAMIKSAWPRFAIEEETAPAYMLGIGDLSREGVMQAVGELMRTEEWPPSIAKIRRVYYENSGIPNEHRAWGTILKMSKRGRQAVEPLYREMDPMTAEALREAGGFIHLWDLSGTGDIEAMKRTFIEIYRGLYEEEIRKPVLLAEKLGVGVDGENAKLESGE